MVMCTGGNTSQFPPLKSIHEAGAPEVAPQPVLESKTVAWNLLLMLHNSTALNKFASRKWKKIEKKKKTAATSSSWLLLQMDVGS